MGAGLRRDGLVAGHGEAVGHPVEQLLLGGHLGGDLGARGHPEPDDGSPCVDPGDRGVAELVERTDFGIVTRLDDAGGRMRQQELAASMGWHRSRLSHQLTRMTGRGLVARTEAGSGIAVVLTDTGRRAAREARPVHAAAVRRHLIDRIPEGERGELAGMLAALIDGGAL